MRKTRTVEETLTTFTTLQSILQISQKRFTLSEEKLRILTETSNILNLKLALLKMNFLGKKKKLKKEKEE